MQLGKEEVELVKREGRGRNAGRKRQMGNRDTRPVKKEEMSQNGRKEKGEEKRG